MNKANTIGLRFLLILLLCVSIAFPLTLTAGSLGKIQGTVTNAVLNAPVAGAIITISGPWTGAVQTDSFGKYGVKVPYGAYTVSAALTGYLSQTKTASATQPKPAVVDFALQPTTGVISGQVTNVTSGTVVAGASVQVTGPGTWSGTTDANGRYQTSPLVPGTYTITVTATGFASQSKNADVAAGSNTQVNFALQPTTGTLFGQVTTAATATAIAGASVQVTGPGTWSGTTDANGRYQTTQLPTGAYTITASASGFTPQTKSSTVATGTNTQVDFALQPTAADPRTTLGEWGPVLVWPTVAVHMTVLPDGRVIVWKGDDVVSSTFTTDTYIWTPSTGQFTLSHVSTSNIFCSGHGLLPDGRLLVSGGHLDYFVGSDHTNIFDFRTNTWTQVDSMNAGRWYPTNTTLPSGEVLVLSGNIDLVQGRNQLPQVWQVGGGYRSLTTATRRMVMYPWMFVAPSGLVFNAGPEDGDSGLPYTSYLNTSGTGAWSAVGLSLFGSRNEGSAVMYEPGKVLILGGGGQTDPGPSPTVTAEIIDLNVASPAWQYTRSMAFPRRYPNATILPDGKVLVTGGTSHPGPNYASGAVLPAESWSPATGTWSTLASMSIPRVYHSTAALLPDGRVVTAGMTASADGVPDQSNAQIFSPPYLFQGPRPTLIAAPTEAGYGTQITIQTALDEASTITDITLVRLSSVTHSFNQDQRFNRLSFNVTSGSTILVSMPQNANLAPPGYYMLFILRNGVPSMAKIVRVGN